MSRVQNTCRPRPSAREIKFIASPLKAADVLELARSRLAPDPHGSGERADQYRVTTLYYDTDWLAVYRRHGSFGRARFRIRKYDDTDAVFLERKLRTARALIKHRTPIPSQEMAVLSRGDCSQSDGYWFQRRVSTRCLGPVCQVSYLRHARVGAAASGPFRLTVDSGMSVLPCSKLEYRTEPGSPMMAQYGVVEMKYHGSLPDFFKHLALEFCLEPQGISKYRLSIEALRREGITTGLRSLDLRQLLAGVPESTLKFAHA
jgi:hypothetical protein